MIIYSQLYDLSMLCILQLYHKLKMYNQHRKYYFNISKFLRHNNQKQSLEVFCKNRCSQKFRKIHRKTLCEISKNTFFTEHLRTTAFEQPFDGNGMTLDNVTVRRILRVVHLNVSVEVPKSPARIIRKFFQERLIFM